MKPTKFNLTHIPRAARQFAIGMSLGLSAQAAPITWSFQAVPQSDLTKAADVTTVSTVGTLHAAVNAGGAATTVNGVSFVAGSGNISFTNCNWSIPNVSGVPSTA